MVCSVFFSFLHKYTIWYKFIYFTIFNGKQNIDLSFNVPSTFSMYVFIWFVPIKIQKFTRTNHPPLYITKLQSDWSPAVISYCTVSNHLINGHWSVKLLHRSVQGLWKTSDWPYVLSIATVAMFFNRSKIPISVLCRVH